jgi:hypothetical protein
LGPFGTIQSKLVSLVNSINNVTNISHLDFRKEGCPCRWIRHRLVCTKDYFLTM